MHSYLSAFCVLWFIRMEAVWLMFSSLHTMGSSIPQHWGTGIPGSWERLFPAGSQDVSLSVLTEPALQTDAAADSRSFSSSCQLSFQNKFTAEGTLLLCRCLHTALSSFGPVFSISCKFRIPSLWGNRSPNGGWFFHTDPIPWFSYRMYRSCFQLFFITS